MVQLGVWSTRNFIGINIRSCIHGPITNPKHLRWWKMVLYVVLLKKTWDLGDCEEHEQETGSLVKVSEPLDQASPEGNIMPQPWACYIYQQIPFKCQIFFFFKNLKHKYSKFIVLSSILKFPKKILHF